jgi:hypothetical protein
MGYEFLLVLPLLSAVAWSLLTVALGHRSPFGTVSGRFFTLFCLLLAGYSLFDWLAFLSTYPEQALLAIRLSYVSVTFAAAFLFLCAKRSAREHSPWDFAVLPVSTLLALLPTGPMVEGAIATSWGFQAVPRTDLYVIWVAWTAALTLVAIHYLFREEAVLRQTWNGRRRPMMAFAVTLAIALILGLGTNLLGTALQLEIPRLLSSFLFVPAVLLALMSLRTSRHSLTQAMADLLRDDYTILHGMIVYRGGKLIASASSGAHVGVDQDVMTGMLDAIQSFVRRSFPLVEDGDLKAIEQADLRLIVEKGRFCYLVLVILGREDDTLRNRMVNAVRRFEIDNFDFLADWRGDFSLVPDCTSLFRPFFASQMTS